MKARIYINRHRVAANRRHGRDDPCIAVRTYRGVTYARRLELKGAWVLKQEFSKPICPGATIWLEGDTEDIAGRE